MADRSERYGFNPKYLRHNIWDEGSAALPFSTAKWTETAAPLAYIPRSELTDPVASRTVCENRNLFKIVTPIDVDKFKSMLADHPNPDFVASVCNGLSEGFWPWADTRRANYPLTHDG